MDIRLALMAGIDIPIPEAQIVIHQPRIKEIAYIGEEDFFAAIQYISLDKDNLIQDKNIITSLTNFQVLMKVMEQQKEVNMKQQIINLLQILFPSYQIIVTGNGFILRHQDSGETVLIDNDNFNIFQEYIRQIFCVSSMFQNDNIVYNPANDAAKKIADKIMAGRRKVAELKSKEQQKDSILSRYISILTIAVGSMSLEDCLNLTLFQLFDLMQRYTLWFDWDIDLRQRLAGAEPKKEAENWMKNIH